MPVAALFCYCIASALFATSFATSATLDWTASGLQHQGLLNQLGAADPNIFNVRDFGAVGDGSTDDSSAVSSAFDALATNGSGCVYFPTGRYLIKSTVTVANADHIGPFSVRGVGPSSVLLWPTDEDLLVFDTSSKDTQVGFLQMQDMLIASTSVAKSETSTAIRFTGE